MEEITESQYMFVEYAGSTVPVQGQKKRRGGPTEVRSHITKEFHRKTRIKRLNTWTRVPATAKLRPRTGADEEDESAEQTRRSQSSLGSTPDLRTKRETSVQPKAFRDAKVVPRDIGVNPLDILTGQKLPEYIHRVLDHVCSLRAMKQGGML